MSSQPSDFVGLALAGQAFLDEIDDYIDVWHENDRGLALHEFLGMTFDEYALWVSDPESLAIIIRARRDHLPLLEAVNDNYNELRIAARSGGEKALLGLSAWLRQHGITH